MAPRIILLPISPTRALLVSTLVLRILAGERASDNHSALTSVGMIGGLFDASGSLRLVSKKE